MRRRIPRPLLDRFLGGPEPPDLGGYADIIVRDVEALLNTRAASVFGDDEEEGDAAYGLPDLTVAGRTEGRLERLAWLVERCLDKYEPRLTRVRVEAWPPSPEDFDRLTVRITAALAGFEKGPVLNLEVPLPAGPAAG